MSKKNRYIIISIILIALGTTFILNYCHSASIDVSQNLRSEFNLNLPKDAVIKEISNTYGGIFGDGDYFYEISLTKKSAKNIVKIIKDKWNRTPVTGDANIIMYGSKKGDECIGSYVSGIDFPVVRNGYWSYLDRNKSKQSESLGYPENFTFVIFDLAHNLLYVYRSDI